jgi:hypothetical protein
MFRRKRGNLRGVAKRQSIAENNHCIGVLGLALSGDRVSHWGTISVELYAHSDRKLQKGHDQRAMRLALQRRPVATTSTSTSRRHAVGVPMIEPASAVKQIVVSRMVRRQRPSISSPMLEPILVSRSG